MSKKAITQTRSDFLLFSISLHIGLLLAIGFYFNCVTNSCVIGKDTTTIINSYAVMSLQQAVSNPNKLKKMLMSHEITREKSVCYHVAKKRSAARMRGISINKSEASTMSSSKKGNENEALLTLLHAAIQKQQQYPFIAQQMQRQGRVTIKFLLYPNGSAINIHVEKSSGTESLDSAALAAVKHAVPFQEVNNYLHQAQEYSVDIVFALT